MDDKTLLIIEGVPYALVKESSCKPCVVCSKCDLRDRCLDVNGKQFLLTLCMPEGYGGEWYFIADWDAADKKVSDYIPEGVLDQEG